MLDALIEAELRATAAHEAGHAVVDHFFDIPFSRVEVFTDNHEAPESESDYAGIVRSDRFKTWPSYACVESEDFDLQRAKQFAEPLLMSLHAGRIAESIYARQKVPAFVARFDREAMQIVCYSIGIIGAEARKWLARMETATRALLRNPDVWAAVERVAKALVKRNVLTFRAVGRIMYGTRAKQFI